MISLRQELEAQNETCRKQQNRIKELEAALELSIAQVQSLKAALSERDEQLAVSFSFCLWPNHFTHYGLFFSKTSVNSI